MVTGLTGRLHLTHYNAVLQHAEEDRRMSEEYRRRAEEDRRRIVNAVKVLRAKNLTVADIAEALDLPEEDIPKYL